MAYMKKSRDEVIRGGAGCIKRSSMISTLLEALFG
jgi:hypothetical protein